MKHRKGLKLNNKGSGIVTVLIAILFLTAFGSVILMLSYTGYEMRISDRKGKENLYDASSIIEQVNAGMQEVCSEAIVYSYGGTLIKYNDYGVNVTRQFQENYRNFIGSCKYTEVKEDGVTSKKWIFVSTGSNIDNVIYKRDDGNYYYRLSKIKEMVEDRIKEKEEEDSAFGYYKEGKYEIYAVDENGNKITNNNGDGLVSGMNGAIELDQEPDPIQLKGVCVEFTNRDRTTKISTDITLNYPQIGYSNKTYKESGLNQHACVVEGNLIQHAGANNIGTVMGSAYFGGVILDGSALMTFKRNDGDESRFVIRNGIDVSDSPTDDADQRFTVEGESEVWANDITVHNAGTVALTGTTYVYNDLLFDGPNSVAVLAGEYYGFGIGEDANGNKLASNGSASVPNSKDYSAIISNQLNTNDLGQPSNAPKVDMTNLQKLTIAGTAVIGSDNAYYSTGESMSSRKDQLAYLLPYELVTYDYKLDDEEVLGVKLDGNPVIMSEERVAAITAWHFDNQTPLWKDVTLTGEDYGIEKVKWVYERSPGTTQVTVYAYAEFRDNGGYTAQENANRFFRDFFKFNPNEAANYVENYMQIVGRAKAAETSGNTFYYDETGKKIQIEEYLTGANLDRLTADARAQRALYERYKDSLNMDSEIDADSDSPLKKILNDNLDNITNGYVAYKDEDGQIVAIAANEDITIYKQNSAWTLQVGTRTPLNFASANKLPCLIVTTGNVIMKSGSGTGNNAELSYDGLIMCKGDMTLVGKVTLNRDPENVTKALVAKNSNGETITDFIDNEADDSEKMGAAWTVTALVTYDNWNRSNDD